MATPKDDRIEQALKEVIDPELGVNIIDLGLVYSILCDGGRIAVVMTMTTPACPICGYLRDLTESVVRQHVPEAESITVEVVWDPPWTPKMVSPDARRHLGWTG